MANSELKAALRTFYREKSYALINLSGLALAIACCLILGLYLRSELTYDRHHVRYKQIFRVSNEFITSGSPNSFAVTSIALGPLLKENYPEVKDYVRLRRPDEKLLVRSGDKSLYWSDIYLADPNVFDIFTHKIIYGDPKTALKDPSSAAVSRTFAQRYFGDINPIGKTIHADLTPAVPRKITLVFQDLPENTHLKYSALFRLDEPPANIAPRDLLFGISLFTYLVMPENYKVDDFKAISKSFFARFMEERGKTGNMTWKSWLEPLPRIHLYSDVPYDLPRGNRYYVYGFTAVAAFILIVACINYVNLAIARGARRAKEIGMRKILGVPRFQLIFRYLGESVIFAAIAMVFSVVLVEVALRLTPINDLLGKPLKLGLMDEPILLAWMAGLSLFIGLLAGFYPAFYLSSISPLSALASTHGGRSGGFRLREVLVLVQFTASVIVIACTLIMALQMRYISNKPLGFSKENRVLITLRGLDLILKYPIIKNELSKNSHVLGVSAGSAMMSTGQTFPINIAMMDNRDGVLETAPMTHMQVADDFIEVMGMQLASGRDFSKRYLTDVGASFVVNETMVKAKGWKEPLGRRIGLGQNSGRVIGVVKDFHFKSLHDSVEPFAMYRFNDNFDNIPAEARAQIGIQRVMVVKLAGTDIQQTLEFLQKKFAGYDPKHPFEYTFLDDSIDRLYLSENRLMKMTGIFSGICIFISCLGLFGLASYATEQRSREIGIRKVLGASISQIILMLARNILWLVLAGSIVASVIAYYAIEEWMTGFAYRTGIPLWVFFVSAAVVIAVAFITIALQSYKTARTNPALTLRYE
jgi:putative ABC transport system permease protein